jgi:predicted anti-sigma-YlaC factor YlaD
MKSAIAILAALLCGLALASYDTRTDDTAIELGLLLIASVGLTLLAPKLWWAIALLVGGFIPLVELAGQLAPAHVPAGAVALVVTFVGALGGFAMARASRTSAAA